MISVARADAGARTVAEPIARAARPKLRTDMKTPSKKGRADGRSDVFRRGNYTANLAKSRRIFACLPRRSLEGELPPEVILITVRVCLDHRLLLGPAGVVHRADCAGPLLAVHRD